MGYKVIFLAGIVLAIITVISGIIFFLKVNKSKKTVIDNNCEDDGITEILSHDTVDLNDAITNILNDEISDEITEVGRMCDDSCNYGFTKAFIKEVDITVIHTNIKI